MDPANIRTMLMAAQAKQSQSAPTVAESQHSEEPQIEIPINALPSLSDEESLIDFFYNDSRVIVCVKELSWPDTLDIDSQCYTKENEIAFHNEEKMMRLTLNKSIKWIAEFPTGRIVYNTGNILSVISLDIGRLIWQKYQALFVFSAEQAADLMSIAVSYFRNEAQENTRVPSLVVLVDMMAQGVVSYNEKEFLSMPASKLEKIKLILAARMEALYSDKPAEGADTHDSGRLNNLEQDHVKKMITEIQSRRGKQ